MNLRCFAATCRSYAETFPCGPYRFLGPRLACTDAFAAVESMLISERSAPSCKASKIFSSVPSSRQRQKQLYTVWCGPYLAGRSSHLAPLRAIHNIPFMCARISFWGRPLWRRTINGSMIAHSASVISYRWMLILALPYLYDTISLFPFLVFFVIFVFSDTT